MSGEGEKLIMTSEQYEKGLKAGNMFKTVIFIGIIVLCIFAICIYLAAALGQDVSSINSTVNKLAHQGCKSGPGCGYNCPHVDADDIRVVMNNQADSLAQVASTAQNGLKNLIDEVSVVQDSLKRKNEKGELSSTQQYKNVADKRMVNEEILKRCLSNIQIFAQKADLLAEQYRGAKTITSEVIKAANAVAGYESAVAIQVNVFATAAMDLKSTAKFATIDSVSPGDRTKIYGYEDYSSRAASQSAGIKGVFDELNAIVSAPEYKTLVDALVNNQATAIEDNLANVALLMNMAQDSKDKVINVAKRYQEVEEAYDAVMKKVESFSNALPSQLSSTDMTDLISTGDYDTALIKTALEPEIVSNHQRFAKERSTFDSGGGVPSVRDDDNDVVPWVGLFGRPTYRRSDGSSADVSAEPLRSIPSDNPTDLMRKQTPRLSFS